jgi:hypothetical protein
MVSLFVPLFVPDFFDALLALSESSAKYARQGSRLDPFDNVRTNVAFGAIGLHRSMSAMSRKRAYVSARLTSEKA